MRKSNYLLIILILAALQVTVVEHFKIFGTKPDLLLIALVIVSLSCNLKWAIIFSLIAGALKDIFSAYPLAINSLLSVLWSFLVVQIARRINLDINLSRAGLVFLVAILNAAALRILFLYLGSPVPLGIFLRIIFLGSLYTALVSPLVFRIIKI